MSELTDYLRSMSEVEGDTFDQAADEIERLRAEQVAMGQDGAFKDKEIKRLCRKCGEIPYWRD
ncbi:MAG: hypothetical protein WBC22_00770 [Sedimentisphaerales bacterium]